VNNQLNETLNENVLLKEKLQELEFTNESQVEPLKISSNKSDDGWCINGKIYFICRITCLVAFLFKIKMVEKNMNKNKIK